MKRIFFIAILFLLPACAPTLKMEQHGGAIRLDADQSPCQVAILALVAVCGREADIVRDLDLRAAIPGCEGGAGG